MDMIRRMLRLESRAREAGVAEVLNSVSGIRRHSPRSLKHKPRTGLNALDPDTWKQFMTTYDCETV